MGPLQWRHPMCMRLDTVNNEHMLRCYLLLHPCTLDDLLEFNDIRKECEEQWKKLDLRHGADDVGNRWLPGDTLFRQNRMLVDNNYHQFYR